ncbi:MAG TPA: hypothetical protein VH593_02030 [Ktedonobacteraceae bacterium]|jgi:hypothetical protein
MLFTFFIAMIVMSILMIAGLAIHMRIRSGETRPTINYHRVQRVQAHRLHDVIFDEDTEDKRIALPA